MKIVLIIIAAVIAAILFDLCAVFITLLTKQRILLRSPYTSKRLWLLMLVAKLAVALKIKPKEFMKYIIDINNRLIEIVNKYFSVHKVLLLLPRCLQNQSCSNNVVEKIENCKACGKCKLAEISLIKRDKNIEIFIAAGTEIAQARISELNPDYVVAIACERELFFGIAAITRVPVYAIFNQQPEGPCKNTMVDTTMIKYALLIAGV